MPRCSICKHAGDSHFEYGGPQSMDDVEDNNVFPCAFPDCTCPDYELELDWTPEEREN